MRTYPRIGGKRKIKPQGKCKICGKPLAELRVTVQWNMFRGDDDVYVVHRRCIEGLGDAWLAEVII